VKWWVSPILTPLCGLLVWSHIFLAIAHWSTQLTDSRVDRLALATVRYMWLLLSTGPFLAFGVNASTLDVRWFWIVLMMGPNVLPCVLLGVARRAKAGPGLFAVQQAAARLRADLLAAP